VLEWFYSFSDELSDEQKKTIEMAHPIINSIKDNKNIEISMIYRQGNSQRTQHETGHYLINELLPTLSSKEHKNKFLEKHHWISSYNNPISDDSRLQKLWGRLLIPEHISCDSQLFEVYHHSKNIRVKISQELLKDHVNEHNTIATCLSFLALVAASDHSISRIAIDRPLHLLNNNAKMITQSASPLSTSEFESYSLNGLNQIIGICDTGIDMNSCFFRDEINGHTIPSPMDKPVTYDYFRKIVQYINYSGSDGDMANGHGSHVSGSVAGNCIASDSSYNVNNVYNGMASASKIAFFDIGVNNNDHDLKIPFYLEDIYAATYSSGARIHSNSWGGGTWYDEYALETDKFLYEHPDFLLLFAAGNDGSQGLHTVLTPGITKNAISVGGSENNHDSGDISSVATFSAQGPTPDGRIKPDIVAPASYIISVASASENTDDMTCNTQKKSGTSMASPVAAGNAALIRQYLMGSSFWGTFCHRSYSLCTGLGIYPSGALVKAMMIHSAVPMSSYGSSKITGLPDMQQGYGRINLHSLLPLKTFEAIGSTLFIDEQTLSSYSEIVYNVSVTNTQHPFKVTISWYDPPNTEFAAKVLLHDLDLIVFDPHGQTFYGNAGMSLDGRKTLGSQRDELNNNEQVWIDANAPPLAGLYRIHVQSKLLTESKTQKFAIVITAGGLVTEPTTYNSLNSSDFHECAYGGLISIPPKTELDIAKFKTVKKGATYSDYYTISDSKNTIFQGSFAEQFDFSCDKACLGKGCFQISLNMPSPGSQIVIPDCNIYLAPTYTTQSFCIDDHYDDYGTQKFTCKSECLIDSHILLPIILVDLVGESWKGIYYSIEIMNNNNNSNNGTIVAAGALQWGYEESRLVCLPSSNATVLSGIAELKSANICYKLKLSIPSILPEVEPFLSFENIVSYTDSTGNVKASNECPYMVSLNSTFSTVCINEQSLLGSATFFSHNDYENTSSSSTKVVGSCTFKIIFEPGIHMNSSVTNYSVPTEAPSIHPTIPPPTMKPTTISTLQPTLVTLINNGTNNENTNSNSNNPSTVGIILSLGFEALFLMALFLCFKKIYRKPNNIDRNDTLARSKAIVNTEDSASINDIEKVIHTPLNHNYEMVSMKQDEDDTITITSNNPLHESKF